MNEGVFLTLIYAVYLLMAASPAIWMLCIATARIDRILAVVVLAVSLIGFIGLSEVSPPKQINHLYSNGVPAK